MLPQTRKVCRYDGRCYRKNAKHFQEYSHPQQYPDAPTQPQQQQPGHDEEEGEGEGMAASRSEAVLVPPRGAPAVPASATGGDDTAPIPNQGRDEEGKDSPSPRKRARPESVVPAQGLAGSGDDDNVSPRASGPGGGGSSATSHLGPSSHNNNNDGSFTDGCENESFTSTTPTEVVREQSSSSSYVAAGPYAHPPPAQVPRHTPPTVVTPALAHRLPPPQLPAAGPTEPLAGVPRTTAAVGPSSHSTSAPDAVSHRQHPQPHTTTTTGDNEPTPAERQSLMDSNEGESRLRADREHEFRTVTSAQDLQEGTPCMQLVEYLMLHDPMRACVDEAPSEAEEAHGGGGGGGGPSAAAVFPNFANIDALLTQVYAMKFLPGDGRTVLLAALALKPSDPLGAFPGWRLVGPFELALRCYRHQEQQQQQGGGDKSARSFFKSEAAQWRCARYRHDPPECQTIAVEEGSGPRRGRHLCYFRDDPMDSPSLLVEGTETDYSFALAGVSLTAFLGGEARETKRDETLSAFASAIAALGPGERALLHQGLGLAEDGSAPTLDAQRATAERLRKKARLATTFHGLGVRVPYDTRTELGYRPLTLTRKRLQLILENWDSEFAGKVRRRLTRALADTQEAAEANATILATLRVVEAKQSAQATRPFTTSDWNEIHEQFRYADMANDEGDFGLNLELGLDIFSFIAAPSLLPTPDGGGKRSEGESSSQGNDTCNPLLWHAFRILDCVYMLTGRSLYRHILRCHLPVLAGQRPVLLDSRDVFCD